MCSGCYTKKDEEQSNKEKCNKRQRRHATSGKQGLTPECGDSNSQNHHLCNLVATTDDAYFAADYLSKKASKGHHVPSKCALCNKKISNKDSIFYFISYRHN